LIWVNLHDAAGLWLLIHEEDAARCCPRSAAENLLGQRIDLETFGSDTTCYKIAQQK
jgi:hypothetical protein